MFQLNKTDESPKRNTYATPKSKTMIALYNFKHTRQFAALKQNIKKIILT